MANRDYIKYVEETRRRRGKVIECSVIIERFIDIYIASRFCSRKKKFGLMQYVLSTRFVSAESKRQIFFELLEKFEPKYFKEHQDVLSKISKVYTARNLYGHQLLVADEDSVNRFKNKKVITLAVLSDKKEVKKLLPVDEFKQICKTADNCATVVRELLEKRKYLPLYGNDRAID